MEKEKEKVNRYGQIAVYMKGIGKMERQTDRVE